MDLNEQLKQISVDGMKQLGDWVHAAKDFAVEQAPLFAQEYVRWFLWSNAIWAVFHLVMTVVWIWAAVKLANKAFAISKTKEDARGNEEDWFVTGSIIRGVAVILALISARHVVYRLDDTAKAIVAPRVVIVEGISEIVQGNANAQK